MKFTYKKLSDPKDSKFDRKWQWTLTLSWFSAANELELTQMEGRAVTPHPVRGFGIFLLYDWKFSSSHIYYDGNNCGWAFGPINIFRYGLVNCNQCEKEHYS